MQKESLPWQLMHEFDFWIFFLGIRWKTRRDFPEHGKVAHAPARQARSHTCLALFSYQRACLLASLRFASWDDVAAASAWRCTHSLAASSS
jgi:hypothetical protein